MRTALRVFVAFALAALVTTVAGSVVQTQFNLAALQGIDVPVPLDVRLSATGRDLLGFTPSFGAIVAAGFFIAFAVAALLGRKLPGWRHWLYPLAGATAIAAAMLIMQLIFSMSPVAATRGPWGLMALALSGALGGAVYWRALRMAP